MPPPCATAASHRARPLPPDERRAALIAATLPLIKMHGADVSTRQIAEAAGVAEGTIFRAFPDKESLVRAAVESALDPSPLVAELEKIDSAAPLEHRLVEAVRVTQNWLTAVIVLMMALRGDRPRGKHDRRPGEPDVIGDAVVRLIEPDQNQLRVPPARLAKLLRLMIFSSSHPMISDGDPLSPDEIVTVLLHGVHRRDVRPDESERPC